MSLKGTLGDLSVPDLLQIPLIGRLTGSLAFSNGDREAVVYYHNGTIVHAEAGDLKGEGVIYDLLEWVEGKFSFDKGRMSDVTTIKKDVQHLLLEGLRRMDERAKAEADHQRRWREQLGDEAALADLLTGCMTGAAVALKVAWLVDKDARILAAWPAPPAEGTAEYAALRTCVKIWKGADTAWEQIYWGGEGAWVAARSIGPLLLLGAVAKGQAGLGQLHFAFKKAADLVLSRVQIPESA
ncbi:DUF4388 domain-containing protein [Candidatus Fermentibacteria bacterium]|nr:DUF4388 domain-containing protein [Candidatus Fermentibacteria bacterium]